MKFDIYGHFQVDIRRENSQWVAYRSELGKRSRLHDVVVPAELDESELAIYLDDIFHEFAGHGQVVEPVIAFLNDGDDWHDAVPILAGTDNPDHPVATRVGIVSESGVRLCVRIASADEYCLTQAVRLIGGVAYIGYGERIFVVDLHTRRGQCHPVDGYFSAFYSAEELETASEDFSVLASSASELLAFDRHGSLLWKAAQLGIDGVQVHSVSERCIRGDGEWDPPGGWKPFVLAVDAGTSIAPDAI